MPFGDRTGPSGLGPRSGRGLGFCSGWDRGGFANAPGPGRFGFGHWRGREPGADEYAERPRRLHRRWFGFGFRGPLSDEEELGVLKDRAKWFERTLAAIRKRISELEGDKTDSG